MQPTAHPRTTNQVLRQQQEDSERDRAQLAKVQAENRAAVALSTSTALTVPATRPALDRYLDGVAPPASVTGRMLKFNKAGQYVTADDGTVIGDDIDFIANCPQTLAGFIKFNPDGPPDRAMGLIFDGFIVPERESLGDLDENDWPRGLSGGPEDPWRHQMCLVLQQAGTAELFTFVTSSKTGRAAVGKLLQHFRRTQKTHPGMLPVVRLKQGGFDSKKGHGWVTTPAFAVSEDSAVKPDTSPSADLDDEIPFDRGA
jgi:hypothetical protein